MKKNLEHQRGNAPEDPFLAGESEAKEGQANSIANVGDGGGGRVCAPAVQRPQEREAWKDQQQTEKSGSFCIGHIV